LVFVPQIKVTTRERGEEAMADPTPGRKLITHRSGGFLDDIRDAVTALELVALHSVDEKELPSSAKCWRLCRSGWTTTPKSLPPNSRGELPP
jgi:hypothetical protein